jgi:hypothetical protein
MTDGKPTADTGSLMSTQEQRQDGSNDKTCVSLGDSCDGAPELAAAGAPPEGGACCGSAAPDYCTDEHLPTKVASGVGYSADTS